MEKRIQSRINIAKLIALRYSNIISEEEDIVLERWINASESNEDEYKRIFKDLAQENCFEKINSINMEDAWRTFQNKQNNASNRFKRNYFKYAVGVFIPVFMAISISIFFNTSIVQKPLADRLDLSTINNGAYIELHNGDIVPLNSKLKDTVIIKENIRVSDNKIIVNSDNLNEEELKKTEYNTIRTPKRTDYSLILADGTSVKINSSSELKFPNQFIGNKREVFLKGGEVFFKVAKNKEKPFIVHVGKMSIKVLGTSFNINARDNSNTIETTLIEGSVFLKSDKGVIKIKPNQQAVYNKSKKTFISKRVNARKYIAWTNGMFCFEHETLDDILNKISMWYGMKLLYKNENKKELKFSLETKRYPNIAKILGMIEKTDKVRFEISDNTIIIY